MTGAADPSALPGFGAPAAESAGAAALNQPRQAFVAQIMGLPVSIHVRGPDARGEQVADNVETAFQQLRADDAMFSTWREDSEINRIRRGELGFDQAGPRVREVAVLCHQAKQRTDGAFSAWLPGPDGTPAFDPTGLVKGWAVEQAFDRLVERLGALDAYDAMVVAGGDVAVHCGRTDLGDWVVGVEDPRDRSRILRRIPLRTGAVATSGTAARGEHIVDPVTGRPARGPLSATVIGPRLLWADVYATAAFVRGRAAAEWLRRHEGYSALLVQDDGTVEALPGDDH